MNSSMVTNMLYKDHKELSDEEFNTIKEECLKARDSAYCPYSKFRVGCVLETTSGERFTGGNVENASYGAGVCAERGTIIKAVTEGHRGLKLIAISGDSDEPLSPCGICRQFIREFGPNIPVFMFNNDGSKYIKVYLQDLLPLSFGPENLGISSTSQA